MTQQNPYAAPVANIVDPSTLEHEDDQLLAERVTRLGARMIDGFLSLVCASPAFFLIFSLEESGELNTMGIVAGGIAGMALLALVVVNLVMLASRGQTIGKRAVGVAIVRTDGSPAELWRILLVRILPLQAVQLVPLLGPIIGLVDPLFIFRDDRRCIHDLIADTKVVQVF